MLSRVVVHIVCCLVLAGWLGTELTTLLFDHWEDVFGLSEAPNARFLPQPEIDATFSFPSKTEFVADDNADQNVCAEIAHWTPEHVAEWLENIGLGHAKPQFGGQGVGGDALRQLSLWKVSNLELSIKLASQELGLTRLGDVGKFFAELDKLLAIRSTS